MKIKQYNFDPGARSIIQLGEELIGHPTTALGELIKNAYDADAFECYVYVHPSNIPEESFLLIFDDGTGMSSEILYGEWLQPSISSKRSRDRKSKMLNRTFLGSKGIGRLAAMALGQHLTVFTKTNLEKDYNWIYLNREDFKDENTLLKDISFPGGNAKKLDELLLSPSARSEELKSVNKQLLSTIQNLSVNDFNEGTLIIVENLDESIITIINDDYADGELGFDDTTLMRGLISLVTPLGLIEDSQSELKKKKIISEEYYNRQTDDSFMVYFSNSLYENININWVQVTPTKILKKYHYRIIGKVDKTGEVTGHYYCQRLQNYEFDQEFKLDADFVFSNESLRKRRKKKEDDKVPEELVDADVGEFFFDIRIFDRDRDAIEEFQEYLKLHGKMETRRFLDKIVGLRIAKNGFGVKPYGEEEKDWMGLGQMRVQDPARFIGPNQILGYVFLLSPQNDGVSEKTNREGFFENKAFIDLKKILRAIIIELGRRRKVFRLKHSLGRTLKSRLQRPDMKEFYSYLARLIDNDKILKKTQKFITDVTTALDSMEDTLTFSQRLAVLGSGLELVYHELSQPIHQLGAVKSSFKINKNKIQENYKDSFSDNLIIFDSSLDVLEELKKSIEPVVGITRSNTFSPSQTFLKVCRLFNQDIKKFKIQILVDNSIKVYQIKDFEYAIWVAMLNIINNAIYWLKLSDNARYIRLKLEKHNKLVIMNSGPEIDDEYLDLIFEYGITLKKEKNATGLGLSFTRSILSKHDWEISAENRDEGPAFIFFKSKGGK